LVSACACAGSVERDDPAVGQAEEGMKNVVRVEIESRDRALRIDAVGNGAWPEAVPAPGASNSMILAR
jgi:hypothetical protein